MGGGGSKQDVRADEADFDSHNRAQVSSGFHFFESYGGGTNVVLTVVLLIIIFCGIAKMCGVKPLDALSWILGGSLPAPPRDPDEQYSVISHNLCRPAVYWHRTENSARSWPARKQGTGESARTFTITAQDTEAVEESVIHMLQPNHRVEDQRQSSVSLYPIEPQPWRHQILV